MALTEPDSPSSSPAGEDAVVSTSPSRVTSPPTPRSNVDVHLVTAAAKNDADENDADENDADVAAHIVNADTPTSSTSPLALLGISEDEVKEVKEFASKTGQMVSKGFSSFLSSVSQVGSPNNLSLLHQQHQQQPQQPHHQQQQQP